MGKKLSNTTVGHVAELCAAKELVKNGFRVYFPHQANAKDDDLIAVNKESGNVYRIQVKSKNDTKPWSAIYFKSIKEKPISYGFSCCTRKNPPKDFTSFQVNSWQNRKQTKTALAMRKGNTLTNGIF
jgi:hypothetical protein